jgi:transposase
MCMNTPLAHLVRLESVDDLPILFASLQRMGVAELLDRHFPSHYLWAGELSLGEVVTAWLIFLASQGDHRLSHLQPWAEQHLHTLSALFGKVIRPLDFHDDRLADILDALAQQDPWQDFETDLNQHTVRVYNLAAGLIRIDTTTASSYADVESEEGLLQFGHSKDRDDLPQLKIAVAALDPLGMPLATAVVPGCRADDPLYVPAIQQVQRAIGKGGKTYVGDCKMAALATRGYLASTGDYYLCPLSEVVLDTQERHRLLAPAWSGEQKLESVLRPLPEPATDEDQQEAECVAKGFAVDRTVQATVEGKEITWNERLWLVRSEGYAKGQIEQMDKRLRKAQEQLAYLNVRQERKKRLSAAELTAAAEKIIDKQRVGEFLSGQVQTTRQERPVRGYRGRPERGEVREEHYLEVHLREEALEQAKQEMGWRVYAVNQLDLSLAEVVWGYRGQYRIEGGWSRLKGQPLSLTPMYMQSERRMEGLVLLLSLVLRLLTLLEWVARKNLGTSQEELRGVYPGQAGRRSRSPSAELLLRAMRGVGLTVVEVAGQQQWLLSQLSPVQQQLLRLWELPLDLYQRLALHFLDPPPTLSEP